MNSKKLIKLIREIIESVYMDEEISAYHGSPHKFDKFSLEKMGSGEGNQNFGWGLYFTDSQDVAQKYTKSDKILIGGKPIDQVEEELNSIVIKWVQNYFNQGMDKSQIIKELESLLNDKTKLDKIKWAEPDIKRVLDYIRNKDIERDKAGGNLYKVKLHKGKKPDQYSWLDWYGPLSNENLKKIMEQLKKEGYDPELVYSHGKKTIRVKTKNNSGFKLIDVSGNGSNFYEKFWIILDDDSNEKWDKATSMFLLRAGIDGIKYPANNISSGKNVNSGFNYVIFDEKAVEIEKN